MFAFLCARNVSLLFCFCLEFMGRLRVWPDYVSGVPGLCWAVRFSSVKWGGPRDRTDLDVFGVTAPTATPQKTWGGPRAHGHRHPVLFPSSSSCWVCVWVSCLTSGPLFG